MKKLTQATLAIIALLLGAASTGAKAQDGATEPNAPNAIPAPDTYQATWDSVEVRHELAKTSGMWWDANGISMGVRLVTRKSIVVSGSLQFQSTSHVLGVNLGSLRVRRALDDQGQPVKLGPRTSYPLVRAPGTIDYTQLVHARSMYWGWPATVISGESDSPGLWSPESVSDGRETEGDAPAPSEEPTAPPGMTGSLAFSVQFDLTADQNVPASLSLLECQALVLCARSYLAADVPFVASDLWHEPVPDLQIRVWKASAGYSEYAFGTESRCDGGLVRCFPQSYPFEPARESLLSVFHVPNNSLWPGWTYSSFGSEAGTPMPTYILVNTELLQANGAPYLVWGVQEMRNNYLQTSADSEGIVWAVLAPYAPASIRHIFAVAPYDITIPVTLRDVPVVREDAAPASGASGRTR